MNKFLIPCLVFSKRLVDARKKPRPKVNHKRENQSIKLIKECGEILSIKYTIKKMNYAKKTQDN